MLKRDIEKYLSVLSVLNKSTDDYLYIWDFSTNHFHYFGNIHHRYAIQQDRPYCTPDEVSSIFYPYDLPSVMEDLGKLSRGESDIHNMEYRWLDKNGNIVWISCRGSVLKEGDTPVALLGRVSDTVLKSKVDTLTGLFNKVKLQDDIDEALRSGSNGHLVLFGIDDIRDININFGRKYTDEILKKVALGMDEVKGIGDMIYRPHGDLFAILVRDHKSKEELNSIYQSIQSRCMGTHGISAGAVDLQESQDGWQIFQYAEYALAEAKHAGKRRLAFFSADEYRKKVSTSNLTEEIRESIRNGFDGFSLVYQPQIRTDSCRIFGAEALLRYNSSKFGNVYPDQFIPIIERTQWICSVGMWVLATALEECRKWREIRPDIHVSVNVSHIQLVQKDFVDLVLEAVRNSGLPGEALTLEVTESEQLQNFSHYNEIFERLRKHGISVAVDDFGSGYSSLAYLKSLRVDEIKIDRSLVDGIQKNSYNYRLISNVIELMREANIRVCCEGVEIQEQRDILNELQAFLLQGYLFAKPCSRESFHDMLLASDSLRPRT